ncbi:MAG TPA: ABC transporter permease subunit [Rhodanobacteraceae bacterium]|nr:ABC transporter permease subunit [Rhodanobacteraceae bacterium]
MRLAALECRRLAVRTFPWVLAALAMAWLAWAWLQGLQGFLLVQTRLAAQPDAPGFTDLVAVPLLTRLALVSWLLAPLLTMSMLAGERRNGSLATLHAAGLTPARIVLGKYLAVMLWLALLLALVLAMPLVLAGSTQLDWGKLLSASIGVLLLMAALAALGLACSAFASHPALAAGAALIVPVLLWLANRGVRAAGERGGWLDYVAMPTHLQPLLRGLLSSRDVVYFLLIAALALALATQRLAADRSRS